MDEIICTIDPSLKDRFYKASILGSFLSSTDILFYISEYLQIDQLWNLLLTCKQTYQLRKIPFVEIRIVKIQIRQLGLKKNHNSSQEQSSEDKSRKIKPIRQSVIFKKQFLSLKKTTQHLIALKEDNKNYKKLDVKAKNNIKTLDIQPKKLPVKIGKTEKLQRTKQRQDYNDQLKRLLRKKYMEIKSTRQINQIKSNIGKFPKNIEQQELQENRRNFQSLHEQKVRGPIIFTDPIDKMVFEIIVKKKQQKIRKQQQATFMGKIKKVYSITKEKINNWTSSEYAKE